jgi:hypothetical protein
MQDVEMSSALIAIVLAAAGLTLLALGIAPGNLAEFPQGDPGTLLGQILLGAGIVLATIPFAAAILVGFGVFLLGYAAMQLFRGRNPVQMGALITLALVAAVFWGSTGAENVDDAYATTEERPSTETDEGVVSTTEEGPIDGDDSATQEEILPTTESETLDDEDGILAVSVEADHPEAEAVATTFETYARGITDGHYAAAYSMRTDDLNGAMTLAEFAEKQSTSRWEDVTILSVQSISDTELAVRATFTTRQDASVGVRGQVCSLYDLEYRLVFERNMWLIDSSSGDYPMPCA